MCDSEHQGSFQQQQKGWVTHAIVPQGQLVSSLMFDTVEQLVTGNEGVDLKQTEKSGVMSFITRSIALTSLIIFKLCILKSQSNPAENTHSFQFSWFFIVCGDGTSSDNVTKLKLLKFQVQNRSYTQCYSLCWLLWVSVPVAKWYRSICCWKFWKQISSAV